MNTNTADQAAGCCGKQSGQKVQTVINDGLNLKIQFK